MRSHALFVAFVGVFVLLIIVGGLYVATLIEENAQQPAKNVTQTSVYLPCIDCTTDMFDMRDCILLLDTHKANQTLQQEAATVGVNIDHPLRVAKKIRIGQRPAVTCYYYG